MDPNTTFKEWQQAVLAEDKLSANEHYNSLRVWLERGGFEPSWNAHGRKQFFLYDPTTGQLSRTNPVQFPIH
jgi:hypothetical protein